MENSNEKKFGIGRTKRLDSFEYLGYRFTPLRPFSKKEGKMGIGLPLSSIGISNYKGNPFIAHNYLSDEWDYKEFYALAKEAGAEEIDVFLWEDREVVPCTNELFELVQDGVVSLARQRFQEMKESIIRKSSEEIVKGSRERLKEMEDRLRLDINYQLEQLYRKGVRPGIEDHGHIVWPFSDPVQFNALTSEYTPEAAIVSICALFDRSTRKVIPESVSITTDQNHFWPLIKRQGGYPEFTAYDLITILEAITKEY